MIPEIGHFLLVLGMVAAWLTTIVVVVGLKRKNEALLAYRGGLSWISTLSLVGSFIVLGYSFVVSDFSVQYVANHSNTDLALVYKISALWASHEGSLLLWIVWMSIMTTIAGLMSRKQALNSVKRAEFDACIQATIFAIIGIFALVLVTTSNPFLRNLPMVPIQGRDLNPILQDIGMILHPPVLFAGYAASALSFAGAIAMLVGAVRERFVLQFLTTTSIVCWLFLTGGNALGSWWAYTELGWGGWWFWDPVENASFIPWLTTTAVLHCLLLTRLRGQFYRLAVGLVIVSFGMCLLGTFIVRSGLMASVHAFATDPTRAVILGVGSSVIMLVAIALFSLRIQSIEESESGLESHWSDFAMTSGIFLLCASALAVLVGTLYPLFYEVIAGRSLTVGAPYFNSFFVPMTLIAAGLIAAVQWARVCDWRWSVFGGVLSIVIGVGVAFGTAPKDWLITALSTAAMMAIVLSGLMALCPLLTKGRPMSFAAVLSHVALACVMAGATGIAQYESEALVRMSAGEGRVVDDVAFVFRDEFMAMAPNYYGSVARIEVLHAEGESTITELYPERVIYRSSGMEMTKAGIDHGLLRDFYVSMGNQLAKGTWLMRLTIKPLASWLWIGAFLMMLAALALLVERLVSRKQEQ